jgi:hypothetical protein
MLAIELWKILMLSIVWRRRDDLLRRRKTKKRSVKNYQVLEDKCHFIGPDDIRRML